MDKEKVKKALVLCSFEGYPDPEMGCEVGEKCPYYRNGCITALTDDAYKVIDELEHTKQPDNEVRKWMRAIADSQLAIGGIDPYTPYEQGKWDGLQIAWDILTGGR